MNYKEETLYNNQTCKDSVIIANSNKEIPGLVYPLRQTPAEIMMLCLKQTKL